jgi:hypothetical protein
MLRKIYLFIVIGFMFCAAASAKAQSIRAHIPFDFYVNNQKLPAGDYSISRVSELNPDVLQVRKRDGTAQSLIWVVRTDTPLGSKQNLLVFNRYGEHYFFSQIRVPSVINAELRKSKTEIQLAKNAAEMKRQNIALNSAKQ